MKKELSIQSGSRFKFETGWFGIPGSMVTRDFSTKTHAVYTNSRTTICGATMRSNMEFQICSKGIHLVYIDCERCRLRIKAMRKKGQLLNEDFN